MEALMIKAPHIISPIIKALTIKALSRITRMVSPLIPYVTTHANKLCCFFFLAKRLCALRAGCIPCCITSTMFLFIISDQL